MATSTGAGTAIERVTPAEILAYLDPAGFDPQDAPVALEYWTTGGEINILWDGALISMSPAEWDEVQVGLAGTKLFPQEADGHRDDPPPSLEAQARQVVTKLLAEGPDWDRYKTVIEDPYLEGYDQDIEPDKLDKVQVYEFPTDVLMDTFLSEVGGAVHPLGGRRVILAIEPT